ncbi:MAG: hypothetical protein ABWY52_02220 [Candidatus Limnocylindrales bacterium]
MADPGGQATDPTEGTGPTPDPEPALGAEPGSPAFVPPPETGAPSRDEMTVALTPSQLAVGGAIVAGLLVVGVRLLLGRRRGRG